MAITMKKQKTHIRLEPRKIYDKAIIRKSKSGKLTYSYEKLVELVRGHLKLSEDDATDWVDYNMGSFDTDDRDWGLKIK